MHESTGATKGTRAAGVRGMHGADPPWDPQPDGSIWSHMAPVPATSAKPHALGAAFPAFHSNCNSRAPA